MSTPRMLLAVAATMLANLGTHAADQNAPTEWPSFQEQLRPGESCSQTKAELPEGVTIVPPNNSVPAEKAAFSGFWNGWMCRNAVTAHKLAVSEVTNEGASVVYVVANKNFTPYTSYSDRIKMWFIAGELRGKLLPSQNKITYAMRPDGNLNVKWVKEGDPENWCTGILSKEGAVSMSVTEDLRPTEWPDFQDDLTPGDSSSRIKAVLPRDVSIVPPESSVSAEKAAFIGIWKGWMGRDGTIDHKLVIASVTEEGAMAVYAVASDSVGIGQFSERVGMRFVRGELRGRVCGGAEVAYAMRIDGNLNVKWSGSSSRDYWRTGILSRQRR